MAVDVISEIVTERPAEEVARYAGDPSNAPSWYLNIKSVEWKTPPPVQLGCSRRRPFDSQPYPRDAAGRSQGGAVCRS